MDLSNCSSELCLDLCPAPAGLVTVMIVFYSVTTVLGLLGNGCLVLVIWRQKEMQNVTNILIANLSCSDLLTNAVCVPLTLCYTLMDRWVLGEPLCKLSAFVQCTSISVSSFSLVLIALERHQLVVHPTAWSPAASHTYLAVGGTWAGAGLLSLPFFLFNKVELVPDLDVWVCKEDWPWPQQRLVYTTWLLLLQYVLPMLLVLLCCVRIILRLRNRRRRSRQRARSVCQINTMLVCIMAAFALCWLPLFTFNTLFDWHHEALANCQHDTAFSVCHLVAMASTCINPVIYGFLNGNFRKEARAVMPCCSANCGLPGVPDSYASFTLSTQGSDSTKASSLNRTSPGRQAAESDLPV